MKRAFAGALLAVVTFAAACSDYSGDTTYPSQRYDSTSVTYSRGHAQQAARTAAPVIFDR